MTEKCPLCNIPKTDQYRVLHETELVYACLSLNSLGEGHSLVVPRRHAKLEELTLPELGDIRDMQAVLKDILLSKFPERPPMSYCMMDVPFHASIPEHAHYHLLPLGHNLRTVLHSYDPSIPENLPAKRQDLENLAKALRW